MVNLRKGFEGSKMRIRIVKIEGNGFCDVTIMVSLQQIQIIIIIIKFDEKVLDYTWNPHVHNSVSHIITI